MEYLPYIALGLIVIIIAVIAIFTKSLTTRELTLCAMSVAVSFGLSYLKVTPVANGGSITFAALVPLVIYAYLAGPVKGLLAGLAYSLLQLLQEPYIISFGQVAFDYILPFTIFGLASMLKFLRAKLKGYDVIVSLFILCVLRYLFHVVSGVLYWEVPWGGSFAYSLTYVPIDFAIAAVVLAALIRGKVLSRLEKMYQSTLPAAAQNTAAADSADSTDGQ